MEGPILIVGAGITGLLLAQGLRSKGIAFRLFERDSQGKASRDWGMSMHWGATFLSTILPEDKVSRLNEIDTDPFHDNSKEEGYVMCNGKTGDVLVIMKSAIPRRVSRAKFRRLLSEDLVIEYDKKLLTASTNPAHNTVTASFSDGTTAQGSLLIGCDGSRSQVREILVGDPTLSRPRDADITIVNTAHSFSSAISSTLREIHPVFKVAYHPTVNAMFLLSVLDASSQDPGDWVHQLLLSWTGRPYPEDLQTPESRVLRLKALGQAFATPWSVAASNVPNESVVHIDRGTYWDPRSVFTTKDTPTEDKARVHSLWNGNDHHGLITLAGDAAHPMLPHRGQGLNHSLEDASRLLAALVKVFDSRESDLIPAIADYEVEMTTRGGSEVELTNKQARAAHDWELLMRSPMFQHGANKLGAK